MEITEKNNGYFLGYKDNETSIFIDEKNYQRKISTIYEQTQIIQNGNK